MKFEIYFLYPLLLALILSLISAPLLIKIGTRYEIVDMPAKRKMHKKPTPLLGGVAIYLGAVIGVLIFAESSHPLFIPAFLVGITGIAIMGLLDDILDISAIYRLILQFFFAAAIFIFCLKYYFEGPIIYNSFLVNMVLGGFITVWIAGITNAINWSDGLDGLAGGLSFIASLGFACIFFAEGRNSFALPLSLALCGGIAGFLPYNVHPAKMFMGDCGSMFVGFMLGVLSVASIAQATVFAVIVPIFIILVPIGDTAMAIMRRFINRQPIMEADKKHFHHQLIKRYEHHSKAVAIEWGTQFFATAFGVYLYFSKKYVLGWIVLLILCVAGIIWIIISKNKFKNKTK